MLQTRLSVIRQPLAEVSLQSRQNMAALDADYGKFIAEMEVERLFGGWLMRAGLGKRGFLWKKVAKRQKMSKFRLTILAKTGNLTLKASFSVLWTVKPAILGKNSPPALNGWG